MIKRLRAQKPNDAGTTYEFHIAPETSITTGQRIDEVWKALAITACAMTIGFAAVFGIIISML